MSIHDDSQYLSTPEAAAALGVSVSSVKRWVDEGILPAHKTAGRHRKLLRAEVLALARQGDLPHGDWAEFHIGGAAGKDVDLDVTATELWQALNDGQAATVRALVRRTYLSGVPIEVLADRIVAPAMARLGHDWETARIKVWQEHRGTELLVAVLDELKAELESRAEKKRPLAIGGAPDGDPYRLPTLMAQCVLLDAGWEAVNLGPNTPLSSLIEGVLELRPRLIWLSVSYVEDQAAFIDAGKKLYQVAQLHGVPVAIGGQALVESVRAALPYTTYGDGLTHLAAFAHTLHQRPKRPQRGRPRKH